MSSYLGYPWVYHSIHQGPATKQGGRLEGIPCLYRVDWCRWLQGDQPAFYHVYVTRVSLRIKAELVPCQYSNKAKMVSKSTNRLHPSIINTILVTLEMHQSLGEYLWVLEMLPLSQSKGKIELEGTLKVLMTRLRTVADALFRVKPAMPLLVLLSY